MTSTGAGLVICWTDGFCDWCASWCSSYLIIACFLAAMSLLLTSVEMPSNSLHCFFLKLSASVSYRVERAWSRYFQNSVPVRLHSTYQYVYPFFFIFHFFLRVPILNIKSTHFHHFDCVYEAKKTSVEKWKKGINVLVWRVKTYRYRVLKVPFSRSLHSVGHWSRRL